MSLSPATLIGVPRVGVRVGGAGGRAGQELVLEILMQVANGEDYVALRSIRGFHGSAPSQLYGFVQALRLPEPWVSPLCKVSNIMVPGGSCELQVEYEKRLAQRSESGDTLDSTRYYV